MKPQSLDTTRDHTQRKGWLLGLKTHLQVQGARLLLIQVLRLVYLDAEGAEASVGFGIGDIMLCD